MPGLLDVMVTKFGKVSVFSDLNSLDDISMRQIYVGICGVSEQELHDNLESELHELAEIRVLPNVEPLSHRQSVLPDY